MRELYTRKAILLRFGYTFGAMITTYSLLKVIFERKGTYFILCIVGVLLLLLTMYTAKRWNKK